MLLHKLNPHQLEALGSRHGGPIATRQGSEIAAATVRSVLPTSAELLRSLQSFWKISGLKLCPAGTSQGSEHGIDLMLFMLWTSRCQASSRRLGC